MMGLMYLLSGQHQGKVWHVEGLTQHLGPFMESVLEE